MSSFKADPRYTRRYDDEHVDSVSDTSDEHDIPMHLCRERKRWQSQYVDDILLVYNSYIEVGRAVFGRSFHQQGTLSEFADFVFKYMQPGASKSDGKEETCLRG